ncbi:MAG: sugar phosphate isomerase/epimerase [Oscillospiraceae bacterium]|nr:sugar phosphate isomerase/epimerase [Oscillospiraceae bacterium]
MFKLGILFGDGVDIPEIAEGYEFYEIPCGIQMTPMHSDYIWQQKKAEIQSVCGAMPVTVCSHFIDGYGLYGCGPQADWKQLEFWSARALERCAEIGVKVAGVYGMFFPVEDEKFRSQREDETVKYFTMLDKYAQDNGVLIALEPMAMLKSAFPRYLDGLRIANAVGGKNIKVMADLNYFLELDQPLENIKIESEKCLHVHIQGDGGSQPHVGNREEIFIKLFTILKEIGYEGGVSCACPWVSTTGGELDKKYETGATLEYLKKLRAQVYSN